MTGQRKVLVMKWAFGNYRAKWYEVAAAADHQIISIEPKTQEEFMSYFANNDVTVVVNTWPDSKNFGGYTPDMIREIAASGVKAVCHQGAGYEVVGDIEVWKSVKTVEISNCPHAPGPVTADTAVFLTFGAMRQFYVLSKSLREGRWKEGRRVGLSPKGLTLGILGLGNIGQLIRDRLAPSGFKRIQYYQRHRLDPGEEKGAHFVPDLDEFLGSSDVVIVVVPYNASTYHLLNRERILTKCKDRVVIVNIARGPIIEEDALVDALEKGKVFAAGLDVFEHEPEVHPGLIASDRVFLLPHAGTNAEQTSDDFELELLDNVQSVLETGHVKSLVPELR